MALNKSYRETNGGLRPPLTGDFLNSDGLPVNIVDELYFKTDSGVYITYTQDYYSTYILNKDANGIADVDRPKLFKVDTLTLTLANQAYKYTMPQNTKRWFFCMRGLSGVYNFKLKETGTVGVTLSSPYFEAPHSMVINSDDIDFNGNELYLESTNAGSIAQFVVFYN